MLKKIVKYGNSSAIILDRTILALLNLNEGDTVKLRIHGETLTITPEKDLKPTDACKIALDNVVDLVENDKPNPLLEIARKQMNDFCSKAEKNPTTMKELQDWIPGSKNYENLKDAFTKMFVENAKELQTFTSPEFIHEINLLNEKHQNQYSSTEYIQELMALRAKFNPKIIEFDKEMMEIVKKSGCPQ